MREVSRDGAPIGADYEYPPRCESIAVGLLAGLFVILGVGFASKNVADVKPVRDMRREFGAG